MNHRVKPPRGLPAGLMQRLAMHAFVAACATKQPSILDGNRVHRGRAQLPGTTGASVYRVEAQLKRERKAAKRIKNV